MRVVACAFAAAVLGTVSVGQAFAQCYGAECDGSRSGPSRYYTDPPPGPGAGFERPARGGPSYRGPEPNFDGPRYRSEPDNRGPREERIGEAPPRPPGYAPREREFVPPSEQNRRVTGPDGYRQSPNGRGPTAAPPGVAPPPRAAERSTDPRNAGGDTVTISVAEYRDLQDRARELQRLLGERRDFRDGSPRSGPSTIYR